MSEDALTELQRQCSIEAWPKREPGGQHVGTGPSGIKMVHLPSGTTACVEGSRSQHINKMIALDMILTAITHPRYHP